MIGKPAPSVHQRSAALAAGAMHPVGAVPVVAQDAVQADGWESLGDVTISL